MKTQTFTITFTLDGEVQSRWTNFYSYLEALAAIRDADLTIPFAWEYEISSTGEAAQ